MKKILFLLFIALTAVSCSQDDTVVAEQTNLPLQDTTVYASKTFAALEEYNKELFAKRPRTRGWISSIFSVVGADIVGIAEGMEAGAIIGTAFGAATGGTGLVVVEAICGTICGSAASAAAANGMGCSIVASPTQLSQFGVLSTDIFVENIKVGEDFKNGWKKFPLNSAFKKINIPQEFEYLRRIGEDHNGIIKCALNNEKRTQSPYIYSSEDLLNVIPPTIEEYRATKEKILNNAYFRVIYNEMFDNIRASFGVDKFSPKQYLKRSRIESLNVKTFLSLFMEAYEMYPNNIDDIAEVANRYAAIVEQQDEFTEREKTIMYGALTVSLYSPQLWNNFE